MTTVTIFDKSRLPSRHATVGADRAPHRSYYYAMGLSREDIAQPFVGVVTTWNEAAPCNIALGRQAQVRQAAAWRGLAARRASSPPSPSPTASPWATRA
jgi:dihydroxy-acid dehydratase